MIVIPVMTIEMTYPIVGNGLLWWNIPIQLMMFLPCHKMDWHEIGPEHKNYMKCGKLDKWSSDTHGSILSNVPLHFTFKYRCYTYNNTINLNFINNDLSCNHTSGLVLKQLFLSQPIVVPSPCMHPWCIGTGSSATTPSWHCPLWGFLWCLETHWRCSVSIVWNYHLDKKVTDQGTMGTYLYKMTLTFRHRTLL